MQESLLSPNKFFRVTSMKIERFVANVTAVGSPARAEPNVLLWGRSLLGVFFVNSGHICGRGATLRYRNPLLSPNNFTQGHLVKIEWLVTDVTAVGSPARAERAILGVILAECFFAN